MQYETLPPVATNDSLSSIFMIGFVGLSILMGLILLSVIIARYRRERDGIVTKYIARGDNTPKRRRG